MITVTLRAHSTQKFREKQSYRDLGATAADGEIPGVAPVPAAARAT